MVMIKNEIWKPIPGYESQYEVSNIGRVRSLPRKGTQIASVKIISPHIRNGYYNVTLWKEGKQKGITVHRLVMMAFVPNPDNLPCINHKDENKLNNLLENLEWCTKKYNYNYSRVQDIAAKKFGKPVRAYKENKLVGEFPSVRQAGRSLGIYSSSIVAQLKGEFKQAKGYSFEYIYDVKEKI